MSLSEDQVKQLQEGLMLMSAALAVRFPIPVQPTPRLEGRHRKQNSELYISSMWCNMPLQRAAACNVL